MLGTAKVCESQRTDKLVNLWFSKEGLLQMSMSAKGRYIYEEQRLATFKKWPFRNSFCNARKLAEAGFIFCGSKVDHDLVQCQVCLKNLHGWEKDDDPWTEHAKHSPSCLFVNIGKRECDMTVHNLMELAFERTKNQLREEQAELKARQLAMREEVRRQIIELRKLKK
jgi:baculoviral IAP repeat-containing protein 5